MSKKNGQKLVQVTFEAYSLDVKWLDHSVYSFQKTILAVVLLQYIFLIETPDVQNFFHESLAVIIEYLPEESFQ